MQIGNTYVSSQFDKMENIFHVEYLSKYAIYNYFPGSAFSCEFMVIICYENHVSISLLLFFLHRVKISDSKKFGLIIFS